MRNIQVINNTLYGCNLNGILLDDVSETTIVNNIVALPRYAPLDGNTVSNSDVSNNLFWVGMQESYGTHAISATPAFVDAEAGDFRLQSNSPAIDAGKPIAPGYTGNAPDIRAVEYSTTE